MTSAARNAWSRRRLIRRADLLLLETREMPWQDFDGLEGGKAKILSRDDRGNAMVMMVWLPPGELPAVTLPHRHYHRTITEFTFVLSGELPHWEYASTSRISGEMVRFREGFFMERGPGSIHGLEPGATSATGCVLLMWRDGVGNWLSEPEAAEETIEVPYGAASGPRDPAGAAGYGGRHGEAADAEPGIVLRRPDVTVLDTRAMPWMPFPGLRGAQVKVLARDERGEHRVILTFMPPGLRPGARRHPVSLSPQRARVRPRPLRRAAALGIRGCRRGGRRAGGLSRELFHGPPAGQHSRQRVHRDLTDRLRDPDVAGWQRQLAR